MWHNFIDIGLFIVLSSPTLDSNIVQSNEGEEIEEPQGMGGEQKNKEVKKSGHQNDSVEVQEGPMVRK